MDDVEEREARVPLLGDPPAPCSCAKTLSQASKLRGITCQEIFRQAFMLAGLEEPMARAVFARFLKSGKGELQLPFLVRMYCEAADVTEGQRRASDSTFCLGCRVNELIQPTIFSCYEMAFPGVDGELLERIALSSAPLGLDDEEVLERIVSGAPEDDLEWFDLMRQDDYS